MNLNIQELERGIKEGLKKEGFLNMIPGMKSLDTFNKGMEYFTGGGLMNDIGSMAGTVLPMLGSMGGKAAKSATPQNISINLGQSTPTLGGNPTTVRTFAQMSQGAAPTAGAPNIKVSGLLDLGLLRTVLTARTANEMIDHVKDDNVNNPQSPAPTGNNKVKVELTTKYPEIEKVLADPQSRAYLESLLTNNTGYGT